MLLQQNDIARIIMKSAQRHAQGILALCDLEMGLALPRLLANRIVFFNFK